jgi:hypothetical protein
MSQERKELFFCQLDEVFEPKENMSPYGLRDKWRIVPVTTEEYSGHMLYAAYHNEADLTFSPRLQGWYKIYLHFPSGGIDIKLTSDPCFLPVRPSPLAKKGGAFMTEVLWRCADMSDESIIISKRKASDEYAPTLLSAIRFVPMTDAEVAAWHYEENRTDTKRIYATDDMHNIFYHRDYTEMNDWLSVVENYAHSDVEWISIEQIRNFVCDRLPTDDIDHFAFPRAGDMLVQKTHNRFDYDKVLKHVVKHGKKRGFKMSVSLRMGAWGMSFPYDQYYFDCDFMMEHPELRTVDRNGDEIAAMSYAYPEVRDHMVNELVNMARTGCDAVTLIAHRGIPYVLFEKPVADRFRALYGEDPYELPLDEPRLHRLHCDIMTEFFRAARQALDESCPDRHVELHLRGMFSVEDTNYIGFDVEQLSREGLVDAIISYPQRHYEILGGDIWQEGKEWRIDLEKYTDYCRKNAGALTYHSGNAEFAPPYTNYKGELCGPTTQQERVAQWNALEQKYGVKIYFEIMPRTMINEEFKRRAVDLYDCGVQRIALWDTYGRAPAKVMWSTVSRIGHKDELPNLDPGEGEYYRLLRIGKIGAYDISRYNPSWGG